MHLAERVSGAVQEELNLTPEITGKLMEVLLRPHKHKHRGGSKQKSGDKGKEDNDGEAVNGSGKFRGS